jgi:hypothetical protein
MIQIASARREQLLLETARFRLQQCHQVQGKPRATAAQLAIQAALREIALIFA